MDIDGIIIKVLCAFVFALLIIITYGAVTATSISQEEDKLYQECIDLGNHDKFECYSIIYGY